MLGAMILMPVAIVIELLLFLTWRSLGYPEVGSSRSISIFRLRVGTSLWMGTMAVSATGIWLDIGHSSTFGFPPWSVATLFALVFLGCFRWIGLYNMAPIKIAPSTVDHAETARTPNAVVMHAMGDTRCHPSEHSPCDRT